MYLVSIRKGVKLCTPLFSQHRRNTEHMTGYVIYFFCSIATYIIITMSICMDEQNQTRSNQVAMQHTFFIFGKKLF